MIRCMCEFMAGVLLRCVCVCLCHGVCVRARVRARARVGVGVDCQWRVLHQRGSERAGAGGCENLRLGRSDGQEAVLKTTGKQKWAHFIAPTVERAPPGPRLRGWLEMTS